MYTQEDLNSIREAIATGEKSVTLSDGKAVVYRSMDELVQAEARIQKYLESAAGRRRPRAYRMNVSKGV